MRCRRRVLMPDTCMKIAHPAPRTINLAWPKRLSSCDLATCLSSIEGMATVTDELFDLHERIMFKMFSAAKNKHQEQF